MSTIYSHPRNCPYPQEGKNHQARLDSTKNYQPCKSQVWGSYLMKHGKQAIKPEEPETIIIIIIIIIIIRKHHQQDKEETQDHPQETQGNSR